MANNRQFFDPDKEQNKYSENLFEFPSVSSSIQQLPSNTDILPKDFDVPVLPQQVHINHNVLPFLELLENMPIGAALILPDLRIAWINEQLSTYTGYTEEELTSKSLYDLTHIELLAIYQQKWRDVLSSKISSCTLELPVLHKTSSIIWLQMSLSLQKDFVQECPCLIALIQDQTKRKSIENTVRESELKYRNLVEQIPAVIYLTSFDMDGKILYISPRIETLLGYQSREWMTNHSFHEKCIYPEDRLKVMTELINSRKNGSEYSLEYRMIAGNDQVIWVHDQGKRINDHVGDPLFYQGIIVDITDRKLAEAARNKEAQYTQMLIGVATRLNSQLDLDLVLNSLCKETAGLLNVDAVWVALQDEDGFFNFATGYGLPADFNKSLNREFVTDSLIPPSHDKDVFIISDIGDDETAMINFLYAQLSIRTVLWAFMRHNNQAIGCLVVYSFNRIRQFTSEDKALLNGLAAQAAQAIANATLYEQVTRQREKLRHLGARLAESQEQERKYLAAQMHDQVGQNLMAIAMRLDSIKLQVPEKQTETLRQLDDCLALIAESTDQVRGVMAKLRPPVLDDFGLIAALKWYLNEFAARTHIKTELKTSRHFPRLSPSVETALFRITQEALNNVAEHAQATAVTLAIQHTRKSVTCIIEDDGIGFSMPAEKDTIRSTGVGLALMVEKAQALSGKCFIESSPGKGSRVIINLLR